MNEILICADTTNPTLDFAAHELARYLQRMGNPARVSSGAGIQLSVTPQKGRPPQDDGFSIKIQNRRGSITGPTPRSVLLGVYRYLTLCGCAFLYPGPHGEAIPTAPASDCLCREEASFRYRCISIEGGNARENVLDMIDWLPKVGMNSYHIQLPNGFAFYDRWYSHGRNPYKQAQPVSPSDTARYIREATAEAKRRGLLVQYMGHGWTSEPFGLQAKGWDRETLEPPAEVLALLALVDGKRQVWKNIPVDTNACYSNPAARSRMAKFIVDFAADHSEIDLLHVWLADDWNNYCTCPACRERLPADWYVALLNEVDAGLSAHNLSTRIAFLVYSELLWAPLIERFVHPERFVLLFAPVSLDYSHPFDAGPDTPLATAPFVLNHITLPATAAENTAYLRRWQQIFSGDSFVYIYHLLSCGWEKDMAGLFLAGLLCEDIRRFGTLGMQGTSSCQAQRCAFPTGFAQYAMVRTLWKRDISYETLLLEYFPAAFGPRWREALAFLRQAEAYFPPAWLLGAEPRQSQTAARRFAAARPWAEASLPLLRGAADKVSETQRFQWHMLEIFALLLAELGSLFEAIAAGEADRALRESWQEFLRHMFRYEDELQTVFDMEWFARNFELFEIRGFKHFMNDAPAWED